MKAHGDRPSRLSIRALALGLSLAAGVWASAGAAGAAVSCADLDRAARAAEVGLDLDAMAAAVEAAQGPDSGCDDAWVVALTRDLVNLHVNRFFVATESGGGGVERMRANFPILEEGRRWGETWQLLLTMAEVTYEFGDYDAAAGLYRSAVALMAEAADVLPAGSAEARMLPSSDDFAMIHGRMTQAALLAADYEPPSARRGPAGDGLFLDGWRGFVVKAVPVPVQFEFGSTTFTEKGRKAADHLAAYLKAADPPTVTLVGHTDPVGETDANLRLSEARAEAVRAHLKAAGYEGTVVVVGKGESEPFRPVDAARFAADPDALHAMDRRVELVR